MLHNRDELDNLLKQAFAAGVRWPIERSSVKALSDLGLTVAQLARYFSTDPAEVQALLNDGSAGSVTSTVHEQNHAE